MAYGKECPVCGGMVDSIEYDFGRDMCKECVAEQDCDYICRSVVEKLMESNFNQMSLEV